MEEYRFLTLHKQNALNYTKQYIKIVFIDHNFNVVALNSSNFKCLRSVKKKYYILQYMKSEAITLN